MKHVKEVKVQYLVATDLAARGIDVKGVTHIINYGLPKDLDFYIHRVGRTARAGLDGIAFTIFEEHDQQAIEKLLKRGVKFTYYDFKKGEWIKLDRAPLGVPGKKKLSRSTDTNTTTKPKEQKRTGGKAVAKSKKVKPAYKKKARFKQAKEEQRQRRKKK
jgi:ATP-dependent RNA helicase CshB